LGRKNDDPHCFTMFIGDYNKLGISINKLQVTYNECFFII